MDGSGDEFNSKGLDKVNASFSKPCTRIDLLRHGDEDISVIVDEDGEDNDDFQQKGRFLFRGLFDPVHLQSPMRRGEA